MNPIPVIVEKSSFWAVAPTESVKVSSSTTVAATPPSALKEEGFETIMVNCNPETVSTDYDTADRLYFEPLTFEDVMAIVDREQPEGVIVQFGGQTPLKLALKLFSAGVPIIGTSPESIDLAEDRKRFGRLLQDLGIPQPENGTAMSFARSAEGGPPDRLSDTGPTFLRLGRTGHGHHLRRQIPG